jgi:hypothetical protein
MLRDKWLMSTGCFFVWLLLVMGVMFGIIIVMAR